MLPSNPTKHPIGKSSDPENLNSLKHADELMEKGGLASKDRDYAEASDCYSRALEIRDSVVLSGGPGWQVETSRMDSLTASKTAANNDIPGPNSDVQTLVSKFQDA
ncbi:hypothetical protein POM88_039956 [Heracleum sosnowskyi]|uniref:peroxidase n=1 Tax=Heracleum sosnowskyi TaxID=360622 RepID=A0AAD8M6X1_9APIA|nr:hypothetical protein POM88_039956 [Heracleum sosnowskyi]